MRTRNATITLVFILLLLLFAVVRRWREPGRREIFDRDPAALTYTRHAKCRMECRKISAQEISEVMEKGVIMLNRSNRNDRPCPTYALQARTSDNQYIRVIFAQCNRETKVVTCYDLEREYPCTCPRENKN